MPQKAAGQSVAPIRMLGQRVQAAVPAYAAGCYHDHGNGCLKSFSDTPGSDAQKFGAVEPGRTGPSRDLCLDCAGLRAMDFRPSIRFNKGRMIV
jgi:hypothetical protein